MGHSRKYALGYLRILSDFVEILSMNIFKKTLALIWPASLLCSMAIVSCGSGDAGFLAPPSSDLPTLRLASDTASSTQDGLLKSRPGSYIVMFKSQGSKSRRYFSSFAEEYGFHYAALSESFLGDSRIKSIDVLTSVDLSGASTPDWEPEFSMPKALHGAVAGFQADVAEGLMACVNFVSESDAGDILREWDSSGQIWFAEPNELSRFSTGELAQWGADYANMQHWHQTIKLSEAFNTLAAGKIASESSILSTSPIVAVLDSGVDYEHASLKDNIWTNTSVGAAGCANDIHGCNTTAPAKGLLGNGEVWPVGADGPGVSCANGAESKCDHGTHVAGIIAAKPDKGSKIGGVCPVCKIMVLRVAQVESGDTSAEPSISDDSQIRAFKYLTRFRKNGGSAVRILNASFGKYARSRSLAILVDVLRRAGTGTLVIGAASNEDSMIRTYPAALANAVAVASVGIESDPTSMEKSYFSNYGSWVDIAAPGVAIDSTLSGGSHGQKQGTSMASPVVAGAAGLLLATIPDLGFAALRDRVLLSANANSLYGTDTDGSKLNYQYYYPKVSGEAIRRPLLGSGVIDVNAMLLGSRNTSTGQPLDRVTPGCAVIGARTLQINAWVLLLVLLLPIGVALLMRHRWRM